MPLIIGLFALAGATVLLQIGPNVAILVLGRVLQGISAAVVWVVGLALLVDTVPQAEVGQAMGLVFVAMSLGVLIGPLFGGLLFEKVSYDAVFLMAYGFIGVDIIFRLLMVEKKLPRTMDSSQDSDDKALEAYFEKTINPNSEKKPVRVDSGTLEDPWKDDLAKPTKKPPAILVLLRSGRLLACLWGVMATAILGSQFDSVLPIRVKEIFNWDSTAAGLAFLPITLTAFFSPIVGWGVDKYGPRWFVAAGFVALAPFEASLSLVTYNSIGQKAVMLTLLGMIGLCFDLTITPLLVEITEVVESKEKKQPGIFGARGAMAQAYGLFNFAWAMGSLIGPIWAGLVNERAGWSTMAWSLAFLSLFTSIPSAIWTGGSMVSIKWKIPERNGK